MAKLSAHGTEVARLVTEIPYPDFDGEFHYSYRSDGYILRRQVAVGLHGPGTRHDYGWKTWKSLKDRKRDTVKRMKTLAHQASVQAERDEILLDFTMSGNPFN